MTRQRKAKLLTAASVFALLAAVVIRRTIPRGLENSTPQDAIYGMLDAARDGDAGKYLRAYRGPVRASLEQARREMGDARFVRYLKDSNAAIKGVAVGEPQPLTEGEVKVRVEYVYQDRNEAQVIYLEKVRTAWKIARVDAAERVKTLVPYGTPVQ